MIRLQDIADMAGVSRTTVSNVINGNTKRVSQETIDKITRILKEQNYVPHMGSVMLSGHGSRIIGVVLGFAVTHGMQALQDSFVGELVGTIQTEAERNGYFVMLIGGEKIDNVNQALDRAVNNGVKNLIVQPTHLMHGAEYDEMVGAIDEYRDKFESVAIAEPMLGEVGDDATVINDDKKAVAQAITDEACKIAGYDSMEAAAEDGTAFVFMGHGTSHTANVTYDQMQSQMDNLGFKNAFIGTVEGEPEDTECQAVIAKVKDAGFKKVVLRPLMVVAGDHANNDMAGDDDDSWKSQFNASGAFDSVDCQIAGLGRIEAVEDLYVEHTKAAIDSLGTADTAEETTDDTAEAADDTTDGAEEVTDDSAAE